MNTLQRFGLIMSALTLSASVHAGDAERGKTLNTECIACHTGDGNSTNPDWPKLAGQSERYLEKQLHDFRNDKRHEPSMTPMAKAIASDQDVADLAAYYASQKQKPGSAKDDPEMLAIGESIYRGGKISTKVAACSACHGPTGMGNDAAKFPRISGQHAKYIAKQLMQFRESERNNDPGSMMRSIAEGLSAKEIEAVSQYIAGLGK